VGKGTTVKIAISCFERATDGDADAVLTLSAEHGVVTQGSYFGKKIAGDDVTRYIKIKNNDFVYNDRTTKFYKYGTIKRLSRHTYGIVSPIYKCFRFNDDEIPVFWELFRIRWHDTQLLKLSLKVPKGRFNIQFKIFINLRVFS
jgi:type I restriction enzyme S subunit